MTHETNITTGTKNGARPYAACAMPEYSVYEGASSLVEFRITRHNLNMYKWEISERFQGQRLCNHFD